MNRIFWDYIRNIDIENENTDIDFSDKAFAYDYNEVQELFFDVHKNNYVILAGETGLRKKDMLWRIYLDILSGGVTKEDTLFLDYDLPILHEESALEIIDNFCEERKDSKKIFLIINEIQECGDWFGLLQKIRSKYGTAKVILSSSTPSYFYEKIYEEKIDYYKIVVLSKKNPSNSKFESQSFGVYNEFKYNVKNGIVEIKGLTKEGKSRQIHQVPSSINGIPVKVIASGAFHDRSEIISIELPDSIEMIGDYAFSKCCNVEEVRLPSSLVYIGDHAFLGATKLHRVIGGDRIAHIGISAFYNTKWLSECRDFAMLGTTLYKYKGNAGEVVLPIRIKRISSYAFADSDIQSIDCTQIMEIGEGAFYCCKQLKDIKITIQNVPSFAFYGCSALSVAFSVDSVGKFALYGCKSLQNVSTDNVDVCGLAFCTNVKNISLVNSIGTGAFYACRSIEKGDWCKELTLIGKFALSQLSMVDLSLNKTQNIGDFALYGCQQLNSISINTKCNIGKSILYQCSNVFIMEISGKNMLSSYYGGEQSSVRELIVHGDIRDNFCRSNSVLHKVIIVDTKHFGSWCFYDNSALHKVTLKNVCEIGDWAFAYCENIKEITLPKEVFYVGMNAFRYCCRLVKISILHNKAISFGANAFYSTGKEKSFHVADSLLAAYKVLPEWNEYRDALIAYCKELK